MLAFICNLKINTPAAVPVSHKQEHTKSRKNFDRVSVCSQLRLNKVTQSPGFAFHNESFPFLFPFVILFKMTPDLLLKCAE